MKFYTIKNHTFTILWNNCFNSYYRSIYPAFNLSCSLVITNCIPIPGQYVEGRLLLGYYILLGIGHGIREALFEMCWFYMGIAQIALNPPPPSVKRANVEKSAQHHPGKPLHTSPPLRAMPLWKHHISKRGFPKPARPTHGLLFMLRFTLPFLASDCFWLLFIALAQRNNT